MADIYVNKMTGILKTAETAASLSLFFLTSAGFYINFLRKHALFLVELSEKFSFRATVQWHELINRRSPSAP